MKLKTEKARLLSAFEQRFGPGETPRAAIAPGRSNLIGEHTDYNGGLVLPIAVDRHTVALFRPTSGKQITVFAEVLDATDEFSTQSIRPSKDAKLHWANYVRGTAKALVNRGVKLKGGQLYITSDLPRGAGLSSSASLETATGLALLALAGKKLPAQELAFASQEAEHTFAGVKCGIMDQTVVGRAENGHALLLDCDSITVTQIPIALKGYSFAIFDTGVRHKLASSEYNKRRAECEHAAALMKKKNLRGVSIDDLLKASGKLTANEHKRVRHVLTENMRVVHFAAALARGDIQELGRLLLASHYSLAIDYEVSCAELDDVVKHLLMQNARDGACPGARMTGGGFGGAVVALLKTEAFPSYAEALAPVAKGGSLLLTPAGGARVEVL
ncbi:MAG TPA: galactokinase [Planctomycetota bacterium]|nr:galactokinase [Planctomycetota bacterium]